MNTVFATTASNQSVYNAFVNIQPHFTVDNFVPKSEEEIARVSVGNRVDVFGVRDDKLFLVDDQTANAVYIVETPIEEFKTKLNQIFE